MPAAGMMEAYPLLLTIKVQEFTKRGTYTNTQPAMTLFVYSARKRKKKKRQAFGGRRPKKHLKNSEKS